MLLLLATVGLGVLLPAQGLAAVSLKHVTYWAVSLLFFLYGAKLDPSAVRAGITNWRIQGLTFISTYVLFPIIDFALVWIFEPLLGAKLTPAMVALLLHQGDGGVSLDSVIKTGTQILLPFIIGQLVRPWIGGFVQKHKLLTMVVDRGSILLIVYAAFSRSTVTGPWNAIPVSSMLMLIVVVLIFLALTMGLILGAGYAFRLNYPDRASLFYCGATKSPASGLPIATVLFAPERVGAIVLPLLIYHMSQLLVCAYISQKAAKAARASEVLTTGSSQSA
ncbi:MAG: bile acid:sodium symporter [Breoghania sp.]|nr:bile acid:sodium symporter [Breoghania sp.]